MRSCTLMFGLVFAVGCSSSSSEGDPNQKLNVVNTEPGFDILQGAAMFGCFKMTVGGDIKVDVSAKVTGPEGALFYPTAGCGDAGVTSLDIAITIKEPLKDFYFATEQPSESFTVLILGGEGPNAVNSGGTFPIKPVDLDVEPEIPYGVGKCTALKVNLKREDGTCVVPYKKIALETKVTPVDTLKFFSDSKCEVPLSAIEIDPSTASLDCKGAVYMMPSASGPIAVSSKLQMLETELEISP